MALSENVSSAKSKLEASLTPTLTTSERNELVALVDKAQAITDKKAEIAANAAAAGQLYEELRALEEA